MDNSRLSSLSGELRNMIYTELFNMPDGLHLHIDEDLNIKATNSPPMQLTQTCHAVRLESLKLLYSLNHVTIHTNFLGKPIATVHMVSRIEKWTTTSISVQQAREVPLLTLDFGTLHMGVTPETINWVLLKLLQQLFPKAVIDIAMKLEVPFPNEEPLSYNLTLWPEFRDDNHDWSVLSSEFVGKMLTQATPQLMAKCLRSLTGFAVFLFELLAALRSLH